MAQPKYVYRYLGQSEVFGNDPVTVGHGHYEQPQTFTNWLYRALCHPLRLLHRSGPTFHVLCATGNVYTVTLSDTPTCACPDLVTPSKHILFVLHFLSLPLHHPSPRRPSLLHPSLLLSLPTSPDSLADPHTRHRFHQLSAASSASAETSQVKAPADREGEVCPVCLEEMGDREKVVMRCGVYRNGVHGECFARWKRSGSGRRGRGVTCVMCRARDGREQAGRYANVAVYALEDDHGDYCSTGVLKKFSSFESRI